jgi:hypothetical protein
MDFTPMASMVTSSTPLPPHTSVYPTFGAAFTLANRLGVKPTIETLKCLEFVEKATDPRPAKRQRKVVDPEEEIDLTWTSDKGSPQNDDAAGPSERYALNKYASSRANASSAERLTMTKQLGLQYMSPDMTLVSNILCLTLSEQVNRKETVEWMLDSGASRHFTNNLNNFVEYQEVNPPFEVQTANSMTKVTGQGTVILKTEGKYVRISPVFYIPDLAT